MLGVSLGWGIGGGLVLGLALSVASTVVLLRAITDRGELDTPQGRIAIGWLIVEDLVTIVILVLLPTIAPLLGGTAATHDRFARHARQHRPRARQGGPLRGRHDRRRDASRAAPPDPRLERGLEGAVHAGRARHRDRVRLPVIDGLRRLVRARGVPRRRGGRRIRHEPSGRRRRAAAARCLRRPVLRVGRHAARSGDPDRDAAGDRRRGRSSSSSPRRSSSSRSSRCSATRCGWR